MATLPSHINDREMQKFVAGDNDGETKVRVEGNFSASVSGLKVGGRVTEVSINPTTWTELPAVALANRNAIAVQNRTGQEIKVNYDNSVVGYVGMEISDRGERFYDITDAITLYAKSKVSTVTVFVEEIA